MGPRLRENRILKFFHENWIWRRICVKLEILCSMVQISPAEYFFCKSYSDFLAHNPKAIELYRDLDFFRRYINMADYRYLCYRN